MGLHGVPNTRAAALALTRFTRRSQVRNSNRKRTTPRATKPGSMRPAGGKQPVQRAWEWEGWREGWRGRKGETIINLPCP